MTGSTDARCLLRFHGQAGIRVALRTMAPAAGLLVAAAVLTGDPLVVLGAVSTVLFPPQVAPASSLLAVALLWGVARSAHSRLAPGLAGWIRHLPASGRTHRLTATAGLVLAQGPVLAILAAACLVHARELPAITVCRFLGLPLFAWATAAAVVTTGSRWRRWFGLAAAAATVSGSWWLLGAGAAAMGLVHARPRSARLATPGSARGTKRRTTRRRGSGADVAATWWRITWRAGGWRLVAPPGLATLTLLPAAFFVSNNELAPHHAVGAVRLAVVSGAVLAMASMLETIRRYRPPWPWARTLPWSASRRVLFDTALLAACWVPVAAAGALIRHQALLPALLSLPFLSLRGAAAIRTSRRLMGSASGDLIVEGWLAAMLVALLPWLSLLLLVAATWALHLAVAGERRQLVGRWDELDHLAAGDPQSWRGT